VLKGETLGGGGGGKSLGGGKKGASKVQVMPEGNPEWGGKCIGLKRGQKRGDKAGA